MTPTITQQSYRLGERLFVRGRNALLLLGAAAWAACAYGWATDRYNFLGSYLVHFLFFVTIGWGAMFFVMVQHVTSAVWSVSARRLMETVMITVAPLTLLFLPIALGLDTLYKWASPGFLDPHSADLAFKRAFFNPPFFLIRSVVYLFVWGVLSFVLYRISVNQDSGGFRESVANARAWSAPGLLVLTVTVTMAGVDWVMSLNPFWYSTIFGVYVFSGGAVAFLSTLILIALALRRAGLLGDFITIEHYHDLGKWLFGLIVWWAYIAFSQYMLIWYANLPEETEFFRHRLEGSWLWLSALLLFGHFLVPFLILLPRASKRNPAVLGAVAAWMLVMHGMDLHWLVLPSVHPHGFHIHWLDVATFLAVGTVFGLVFWYRLRSHPLVPAGDLRLEASRSFHAG
jgi:hypothetical protein